MILIKFNIEHNTVNFPKKLIVFSRDELKQSELQQLYPASKYPQLRFFLGDIRDKSRVKVALENVEAVVHAAALKQVPSAERNPFEVIKTNIIGAQNLIEGCIENDVKGKESSRSTTHPLIS